MTSGNGVTGVLFGLAAAMLALAILIRILLGEPEKTDVTELSLNVASFSDLTRWRADAPEAALGAFQRSCQARRNQAAQTPMNANLKSAPLRALYGTWGDWQSVCADAMTVPLTTAAARAFFEANFSPVRVKAAGSGLFTGYYEPELLASRTRSAVYATPLLARPDDLISVDLGSFLPELEGRKIRGRVQQTRLVPYHSRAEIAQRPDLLVDQVLFWAKDPVDVFFLHIQGSGRLRLDTGEIVRVGYADQNGHPYTAIGKTLIELDELDREAVSMQTIRAWLNSNPDRRDEILNSNSSYIFFRELTEIDQDEGPLGAQNVPLTPRRSLAVDLEYHALGAPVWLEVEIPGKTPDGTERLHGLFVAQDTGGAIRGPVRGDLFWGAGPQAEDIAGRMKHAGRMFVLVPSRLVSNLR